MRHLLSKVCSQTPLYSYTAILGTAGEIKYFVNCNRVEAIHEGAVGRVVLGGSTVYNVGQI